MSDKLIPATEAEIAALAHKYWEEEGRPEGLHEIHWQRAFIALAKPAAVAKAPKAAKPPAASPRAKADQVKAPKGR